MKITQIIKVALNSIVDNKLRTSLTMLGVVVGIFSIIVIMTVVTMLQKSIDSGLSSLSKDTFQIQKWGNTMGRGHGRDRRWRNRRSEEHTSELQSH